MTIEAQMRLTRFFDIVLSFIAIVILLPFMIPIMIILKLTGEHHIFYRQPRVGKGGKDFYVFKFATMLKDSPNMPGGVLTQKNDPRILPFGRFLRKTKINELPQLVNILIGQMSFVGPRPQARKHYELYPAEVREAIDKFRPGLTGLASMIFRNESEILDKVGGDRDHFHDTVIAPYKGELELWYSHHCGWRSYFLLIALTIWVLFRPDDSKAWRHFYHDIPKPPKELEPYL
ncbi:MAG TPA: sugar transferase [Rectinema sp.]|nr:sugar transferase [Rectinema sp.]